MVDSTRLNPGPAGEPEVDFRGPLSAAGKGTLRAMVAARVFGLELAALQAAVIAHGSAGGFINMKPEDRMIASRNLSEHLMKYRQELARTPGAAPGGDAPVPCSLGYAPDRKKSGPPTGCREEFCPLCFSRDLLLSTLHDLATVTLKADGTPSGDYELAFRICNLWFRPELKLSACETATIAAAKVSRKTLTGAAAIKQFRLISPAKLPNQVALDSSGTPYSGPTGELIEIILLPAGDKLAALSVKDQDRVALLKVRLNLVARGKQELLKHRPHNPDKLNEKQPTGLQGSLFKMWPEAKDSFSDQAPVFQLTLTQLAWTLAGIIRPPEPWYGEQTIETMGKETFRGFRLSDRVTKFNSNVMRRKCGDVKRRFKRVGVDSLGRLAKSLRPGGEHIKLAPVRQPMGMLISSGKLRARAERKLGLRLFCSLIGQKAPAVALRVVQRKLTKHLKGLEHVT